MRQTFVLILYETQLGHRRFKRWRALLLIHFGVASLHITTLLRIELHSNTSDRPVEDTVSKEGEHDEVDG